MTEPSDIEEFYGAAILLLRWWVRRWGQRKLAETSGVSATAISNYERRHSVPTPEVRAKLARALEVSLADLDRLAASIQAGMIAVLPHGRGETEAIALRVTAEIADDFRRVAFPLVQQFVNSTLGERQVQPASPETHQALAPVLKKLDANRIRLLTSSAPSLKVP